MTLTAGTRYAFIFRNSAAFSSGTVAYTCSCATTGFSNSNPYAAGQRVTSANSGTSWTPDTTVGGRDLSFRTYMNNGFASSGTLVSSVKDANPAANRTPTWTTLTFAATKPTGTDVKFQVAASNSSTGPFNYVGPDGTASTFFATSGASLSQFNGFRYLRYKAYLSTTNSSVTPALSDAEVCFADVANTNATVLAVAPATGTYGGTTSLSSTLTAAGSPLSGASVAFTLNGTSVGSATTDSSGVATVSGVSLAGIDAGSYPSGVGASYGGDSDNDPASSTSSLTVAKADQTISFDPLPDRAYDPVTSPCPRLPHQGFRSRSPRRGRAPSPARRISSSATARARSPRRRRATDRNAAPDVTRSFHITDPVPPVTTATLTPGIHNGWYASPTLTLTGDDGAGSGVAHIDYSLDGGAWTDVQRPDRRLHDREPLRPVPGDRHRGQRRGDEADRVQGGRREADGERSRGRPTAPSYPLDKVVTATFKCTDTRVRDRHVRRHGRERREPRHVDGRRRTRSR